MRGLNSKLNQLYAIETGKGIQHILDKTHEIIGNPALMFDMEYKLIASPTGAENDDPIWCEFMTHKKLRDETIEFFKNESFIDNVANCTPFDGVTYLSSSELKYDRIFGQIYNADQLPVADLVMVACESPFEEYTPELIKAVCNILSQEISQDDNYRRYGQLYQDSIIEKLIDGRIDDKGIYAGHVSNIEKGLKANIFLAVAKVPQTDPVYAHLAFVRDLFKQAAPAFKYSIYSNYIIILISSSDALLKIGTNLGSLVRLFEQEKISVGVSSCFENLFELRRYYLEAVHALNNEARMHGRQQIGLYEKDKC